MLGFIVVSHSKDLAEAVIHLANEMKRYDFPLINGSGTDGDFLGSNPLTIKEAIMNAKTDKGALVFVDIGSSVLNTQVAIDFLADEGVDVENKAIEYIAKNVETNIRDLQSLYGKIIALSELKGVSPLSIIQDGLASVSTSGVRSRNLNPKSIIGKIADYYNITPEELCGKSRISNIKTARQIAMFIMSKDLQMSTPKIALEVGVKDHTTVMHGIRKIESDIKLNFSLRDEISEIREQLNE